MEQSGQTNSIEYELQEHDQLCFVRIPKTGSTTLVAVLDAQFNVAEICPILVADLPQASPEELAKYKLFRDHFDYDIHEFLPHKPVYMTMLRHPVERAVSYYEFCKRCQNQGTFDQYLREATSKGLKEFTAHPDPTIRIRTANLQTRQIAAGLGSRHSNPFEPSPLESTRSEAELLALAKEHLDEFIFVGLTERFQDSILLLTYIFGWYPLSEYPSLRVAAKKSDRVDQDTMDAILEVNQLDLELYQYAQQIFADRFSKMLQELSVKYSEVESALEKHYETRYIERQLTPLKSIDFNFLQALSGSGWHRRNGFYSGLRITSTPFRWTGPSTESTVDFPLATETDLTIRIRITNAAVPDILDSFKLKANNCPIALNPLMRRGNLAVFEGIIPQIVLVSDRPFTRLTLSVNRTVSLQEVHPNSTDKRVVGLAVQRIQIFPTTEQPPTPEGDYMLFPIGDRFWAEAADFLQQHLQPEEKLAAPTEFMERFPQEFLPYSNSFENQPNLSWVVIHKGLLAEVHSISLKWTAKSCNPVFANEVFVIFSRCKALQKLDRNSLHLRSFWQTWQTLIRDQTLKDISPNIRILNWLKQAIHHHNP
jgi:hypothetical protein